MRGSAALERRPRGEKPMRSLGLRFFPLVLLLLALAAGAGRAAAQEAPVKVIQSFYDVLLDVMKNADKLGLKGREQKLDPVVRKTYDLPLMARLTIGPQWQSLTPEQQRRVTEAFSKMTVATYAQRFDGYSGEKFEVSPQPQKSNNGTIVQTRLIKSDGESITL